VIKLRVGGFFHLVVNGVLGFGWAEGEFGGRAGFGLGSSWGLFGFVACVSLICAGYALRLSFWGMFCFCLLGWWCWF